MATTEQESFIEDVLTSIGIPTKTKAGAVLSVYGRVTALVEEYQNIKSVIEMQATPHPNAVTFKSAPGHPGLYDAFSDDMYSDHSGKYYSAAQVAGLVAAAKPLADLTYKYDNDTKPSMITVKFSLLEAARGALSLAPAPQDGAAIDEMVRAAEDFHTEIMVMFASKNSQPNFTQANESWKRFLDAKLKAALR